MTDAKPLFRRVDCVRLYVADVESGLAFYRDKLGHILKWRTDNAVGLQMPDTDTEIVLQNERGGQEIDLLVDSADAAANRIRESGGRVIVPPFDIQMGRCALVQDLWGNQLVVLDTSNRESERVIYA